MENMQLNKGLSDDKENMEPENSSAEVKISVGKQQFAMDSQNLMQTQQPKVMRLAMRSPFQQINMDSIKNAKKSITLDQIVGSEENHTHVQAVGPNTTALSLANPCISMENNQITPSLNSMELENAQKEHNFNNQAVDAEEFELTDKSTSVKRIGDFEIEVENTSIQNIQDNADLKEVPKDQLMEILSEQESNANGNPQIPTGSKTESKEASSQLPDIEIEHNDELESDDKELSKNLQDTKQLNEISIKSVLDLKAMPKDQLMKNLKDLIEANSSSIASEGSTPGNSQTLQTNENISESAKKRRKSLLKEAYGPNNQTISSSIASMTVLKSTIHQSLKVLRGVVQDSKPDSQSVDLSRHVALRQSISSLQEARKKYQNKTGRGDFDGILQESKPKQLDPLDLIIQEKVEAEFKIKSIKKHQSDTLKTILTKQNCIYRYTSTADKNLVYQLPALFTKGLVIYITTSVSRMAEQIPSLPESISGACYNNVSSKENNQKIIELVQSGDVRMLYVSPDKLAELLKNQIPRIEYVVLDEFSFSEDQNSYQMQLNPLINEVFHKEGTLWTKLVLIPPTSKKMYLSACDLYRIPHDYALPAEISFDTIPNISISRDEETYKALLSLLRNQKFSNNLCVIVYTGHKRVADELSIELTQNGVKNQLVLPGKTESQKLELYNTYTKNSVQAIITVSGTELGFDKGLLRRTVHYNMPRTPEKFAQEVLYLSNQAKCHIFVTDEEYFSERNNYFSTIIYPDQIAKFIEKVLLSSISSSSNDPQANSETRAEQNESILGRKKSNGLSKRPSLLEKRRRDGTVVSNQKPNTAEPTVFMSRSLTKPKVEEQDLKPNDEILSFRSSEITQHLKLSKESVATLFEQIDKFMDWIEYNGMSPHTISVRFVPSVNNANLKNGPKSPALQQIWQLLQAKSKKFTGVIRIVVPDLAADMKTSSADVLKQMKSLQSEGFLRYDVLDEIFQYQIKQIPTVQDIEDAIVQVHDTIAEKAYKAIRDIDCCYTACKQFAVQKVDHLSRQKGSIRPATSRSSSIGLKTASEKTNYDVDEDLQDNGAKDPQRTALKQKLIQRIETYLNDEEMNLSMEDVTKSEELPLLRLTTQRDKSLMYTELQGFVAYYFEQPGCNDSADPKGLVSEELQRLLCRQAVRVAIGIPPANSTNEWKTCKFWGRYSKYDPFELTLLFSEAIETIVSGYKQLKKAK